mgnify:CR=1 FL=1
MNLRLTYVVVTLALLCGAVALALVLGSDVEQSPTAASVAVGALAVVVLLGWYEWRRERRAAAMFWLFWSGTTLLVCAAIIALMSGSVVWQAAMVLGASAVVTLWLARVLWQETRLRDLLPDWISTQVGAGQFFEDDGVQWAMRAENTDLSKGVLLQILLQNNLEVERRVRIRLRDEAGWLSSSGHLAMSKLEPVTLPPRGQGSLRVELRAKGAKPLQGVRVYASVDATGPAGARNRRRRASPGARPISRWLVLLAPFVGHIVFKRGGVYLTLEANGGTPTPLSLTEATMQWA